MKIISFGEIMVRFTPPNYLLLEQASSIDMTFVGTGVNLLSGLARFGYETAILTKVPDNNLGKAVKSQMRRLGIKDSLISYHGNHLGSFFVEMGYGNRPSTVTYQNRINSSYCTASWTTYDFKSALMDADVVHICGIALSLTEQTCAAALNLVRMAAEAKKLVCFDFNFRPSLNTNNELSQMRSYYEEILQYCDIVFGSEQDLTRLLGFEQEAQFSQLGQDFMEKFGIKLFAGTTRSNDGSSLAGFLMANGETAMSNSYQLEIYDRIGSGDAYAAGIIHGHLQKWSLIKMVEFATVSSVLAHTVSGDVPMMSEQQIESFIANPTTNLIR